MPSFPLLFDYVVLDKKGKPAVGGELSAYYSGTNVPAIIYNDAGNPIDQPLVIGSDGRASFRIGNTHAYRIRVLDSLGDEIVLRDNVTGGGGGGGTGSVTSVFGRDGDVLAETGDYGASQVTNDSTVTGATVKDALETLDGKFGDYLVKDGSEGPQTVIAPVTFDSLIGGARIVTSWDYDDPTVSGGRLYLTDNPGNRGAAALQAIDAAGDPYAQMYLDSASARLLHDTVARAAADDTALELQASSEATDSTLGTTIAADKYSRISWRGDGVDQRIKLDLVDTSGGNAFGSAVTLSQGLLSLLCADGADDISGLSLSDGKVNITSFVGMNVTTLTLDDEGVKPTAQAGISASTVLSLDANGAVQSGDVNDITLPKTGFDTPDTVVVTYDSTARTVTLSGTGILRYEGEVVHDLSTGNLVSAAHTATDGAWFWYYNGTAFVWAQIAWVFSDAQLAFVRYDAGTPANSWCIRECHGEMPWQTHQELHETLGTYRRSGGTLGGYTIGSTTAAERRPSVAETVVADEDLPTTLPALADNGPYSQLYIGAASAATIVRAAADIVPLNVAIPKWNNATLGTLVDLTANQYMNVFLVAIPAAADSASQGVRYLWMAGQVADISRSVVDAESPSSLTFGNFAGLAPEFAVLARVLIRYTASNWSITSVTTLTGTRVQQIGSTFSGITDAPVDGVTYARKDAAWVNLFGTANTWTAAQTFSAGLLIPDGQYLANSAAPTNRLGISGTQFSFDVAGVTEAYITAAGIGLATGNRIFNGSDNTTYLQTNASQWTFAVADIARAYVNADYVIGAGAIGFQSTAAGTAAAPNYRYGTNAYGLFASNTAVGLTFNGTAIFSASSATAVTWGTVTHGGNLTWSGTQTYNGAVTFNAAVTLGDAAADAITVNGTATFAVNPIVSNTQPVYVLRDSDAASGSATAGFIQFRRANDTEVGYFGRKTADTAGLYRWVNLAGSIEIAPATSFIITTLAGTGTRMVVAGADGTLSTQTVSASICCTQTFPIASTDNASAMSSGVLYYTTFIPEAAQTVANVQIHCTSFTGTKSVLVGVYNKATGAQVATGTISVTAAGLFSGSLSASLAGGTEYRLALGEGATSSGNNYGQHNCINDTDIGASETSSTLPATVGTLSASGVSFWARLY